VAIHLYMHAPLISDFDRRERGQYTDHHFVLAINATANNFNTTSAQPWAFNDAFENGEKVGVQCPTWQGGLHGQNGED
jgi:hypothetical protein